jgi:hypothetical protein
MLLSVKNLADEGHNRSNIISWQNIQKNPTKNPTSFSQVLAFLMMTGYDCGGIIIN